MEYELIFNIFSTSYCFMPLATYYAQNCDPANLAYVYIKFDHILDFEVK